MDDSGLSAELKFLAGLWLHEPSAEEVQRAVAAGLPHADVSELATEYAHQLLLNVPPYGTVFLDPTGELNGAAALRVGRILDKVDIDYPERFRVGASDHVGSCLHLLAWSRLPENKALAFGAGAEKLASEVRWHVQYCLEWVPALCATVERQPGIHAFYSELARQTVRALLGSGIAPAEQTPLSEMQAPPPDATSELSEILDFLLTPGRSGFYLSRSVFGAIGRSCGLPLPFGSRRDVARQLFAAAGELGALTAVLQRMRDYCVNIRERHVEMARTYPHWEQVSHRWVGRMESGLSLLDRMTEEVTLQTG